MRRLLVLYYHWARMLTKTTSSLSLKKSYILQGYKTPI